MLKCNNVLVVFKVEHEYKMYKKKLLSHNEKLKVDDIRRVTVQRNLQKNMYAVWLKPIKF